MVNVGNSLVVQLLGLGTFTARSRLQSLVKELRSCVHIYMLSCFGHVNSAALWTVAHQALLSMDSSGRITGVDFNALLQGIFLTQGSNPCLKSPALATQVLYPSEAPGKPTASCKLCQKKKKGQCSFGRVSLSKSFHLDSQFSFSFLICSIEQISQPYILPEPVRIS